MLCPDPSDHNWSPVHDHALALVREVHCSCGSAAVLKALLPGGPGGGRGSPSLQACHGWSLSGPVRDCGDAPAAQPTKKVDLTMSDRKYRQRGYQDDPRDREPKHRTQKIHTKGAPRSVINREHRTPNVPGFHDVMRCAQCGQMLRRAIGADTTCPSCGAALHTCAQCASFDSSSRFECLQPITARVSPKAERNDCAHFEVRVTVERQTHSEVTGPRSSKQAFDDLFK